MRSIALSLLLLATACGERAMIQDSQPASVPQAPAQAQLETATFALG
jgi:hypothetical protein